MKLKKQIIISLMVIFLMISGCYLVENAVKNTGLKSATIVKVTEKGKVIAYISAAILKQLVQQDVEADNASIGPSLMLTMRAAGVSEFSKVEVKGARPKEYIYFNKKDVTDDLVISLANNGTMNLCRKNNSSSLLITGITELSITN